MSTKIDMVVLKSKIEEIYENKKYEEGWAAWSSLCLWLAQYEYDQKSKHHRWRFLERIRKLLKVSE